MCHSMIFFFLVLMLIKSPFCDCFTNDVSAAPLPISRMSGCCSSRRCLICLMIVLFIYLGLCSRAICFFSAFSAPNLVISTYHSVLLPVFSLYNTCRVLYITHSIIPKVTEKPHPPHRMTGVDKEHLTVCNVHRENTEF